MFSLLAPVLALAQQIPKSLYISEFLTIGYLEYLPPSYVSEEKDYPLMIFLHGGGEGGNGSPAELEKVKSWGPPMHIRDGHNMCFTINGGEECFIVISPQILPEIYSWDYFIPILINHLLNGPDDYKIDPDRIYLTGLSFGGRGTYSFAGNPGNAPNKLAAIVPIAARMEDYTDGCVIAERKIPVWAFHGRKDTVVPYSFGLNAFNSVSNCNDPKPTAEMIFTTYEDTYHDSWIQAYDPSHTYHNPNVYEWMLMQKRPTPAPITGMTDSANKAASFSIYPNPSMDLIRLAVTLHGNGEGLSLEILALSGQTVKKISPIPETVDVSGLTKGVYFIRVVSGSGVVAARRFVKE